MASEDLPLLLPRPRLQQLARDWLAEDAPWLDIAGWAASHGKRGCQEEAVLLCKSAGVLAGSPFFQAVCEEAGCHVTWEHADGEQLEPVTRVATVTGHINDILIAERPALNVLSRVSGVATLARQVAQEAKASGWKGQVTGTRKTTPGFRLPEKYGVLVGGAGTHRYGTSDLVMLKDNHVWAMGGVKQAMAGVRSLTGHTLKVEIECRSLEEALEAAGSGADIVMLDNLPPESLHEAALSLKTSYPGVIVEASGGILPQNLVQFLGPHIDVVSMGCLTQGTPYVDFSLKLAKGLRGPPPS
ncbi:nicotinate-nucleotide pyrophosphorylase [carboxylating] [Spea bombifrons]|uniref:nicotinate-nucleotide pyrophosphorylase [carboxylating] n=1 Tax=Spea bombifrons TaxID=233779 RepID=UPI00234A1165|nr:nicotinate-nucleotide pyrophosphorylase [carboxylating] [Spea bombifrons]XP_053327256.1 nicotinate-nucleotide pyrophosphorylase [carboxylating] [Spea bombifrons]XP_053327257.1 nicotinate-nucleotide pyrophosphorylase [carboxylating] [Spea bombifrons]